MAAHGTRFTCRRARRWMMIGLAIASVPRSRSGARKVTERIFDYR
jgi:hypothetical protein